MKITSWHLSIGIGVLTCYLSWLLADMFWYECFICHGVTPTISENLFCLGVQVVPIIGMLFITAGLYGIFNSKI